MRILLVSNELTSLGDLQESINEGFISKDNIISCMSAAMALDVAANCCIDAVMSYIDLSFYGEGAKLLMAIKKNNPNIYTFLIAKPEDFGKLDPEMGVYIDDYITLPFNKNELRARMTKALLSTGRKETAAGFWGQRANNGNAAGVYRGNGALGVANIERDRQPVGPAVNTAPTGNNATDTVNGLSAAQGIKDNVSEDASEAADFSQVLVAGSRSKKNYRTYRNGKKGSRRIVRAIGKFFLVVLLLLLAFVAFFLLQSSLGSGVPSILGNHMYVVISGSMRPTFDTGSIVFVREVDPRTIAVGDIITFKGVGDAKTLTTHRVVKINDGEQLTFTTRGDANNVNDPNPVPAQNVVGKVRAYIPYLGYLITFSQTRIGLVCMIFIPGGLLIAYELYNIYNYTRRKKAEKKQQDAGKEGGYYHSKDEISGYA